MKNLILFFYLVAGVILALLIKIFISFVTQYAMNVLPSISNWGFSFMNVILCNSLAAFIGGFFLTYIKPLKIFSPQKIFFSFGFLGSLSTFSTYIFELSKLLSSHQFLLAFIFFAFNNFITIFLIFLGTSLGIKRNV